VREHSRCGPWGPTLVPTCASRRLNLNNAMDSRPVGGLIIVLGVAVVVVGLLVWTGALSWFGRLPGDIRIEREHARVYVPIVSMLLISVVLSVILYLARRFF
jgi:hypothetical protein